MADYTLFKLRGDTRANWLAANPILNNRELAMETDTMRFKVGDGLATYSQLPYGRNTGEYLNFYNVTAFLPLPAGYYYTHDQAITKIPTSERCKGQILAYEVSSGVWYTERFIGTDVANWGVLANWERMPDSSDFTALHDVITAYNNHALNKSNPHTVTKDQIGLGNAANTSDLDKPISTAAQDALDNKVNVSGDQTIYGVKSFYTSPTVPNPTNNNDVVNKVTLDLHKNDSTNPHQVTKAQVGLGNADNTSDANKPISTATQTALNLKENAASKGAVNGYASLDETGKVPTSQLPSYVDDVLEYANLASFPVSGVQGKIYVALDTNKTYRWSGSSYIYITSGAVDSVAGKTGVVSLVKGDVGLGNVDNTSDANKPVSTAQQTALNLKTDKARQVIAGSGLTGGGTLESDRTINVTATDDSIVVAADGIKVDTQNSLTSTSATKPLAANQGTILDGKITQLGADLSSALKCNITTIDEYLAISQPDIKTLYVITAINEATGKLEISAAYLGDLKFATGGGGTIDSGIPIEQLNLSDFEVTIEKGATKLITASWQPEDATSTVLSWISSNTLVASVNAGTITGVEKGTAIITVKAKSGVKDTVNVTVVVSLVSLEIEGSGKIVAGYDEELTLVPNPSDADMDITLYSSNSNVTIEKSTITNKLIAKTSAISGSTTIKAVNINGKQATIGLTVVPYIVNVTSDNVDKTDSSVTSIFTNWTIERKGNVTSYKYTESYMKDGVKTTLQSVDYTAIPDNNIIQIELYAEFGNKIIDWTFKDAAGNEESITCNVLYKEPELVHYSFDVDVTCTPEEASAMTMEVPFYKYDKKFAYNLRNDDTKPSIWRTAFRFVNREWNSKIIPFVPYQQNYIDSATPDLIQKSPRRLGYTDGTGIIKTFVFDTAGMVIEGEGTEANPAIILWDRVGYTGDMVDLVDTLKLKDYGGHFLIHNMALLPTDSQYYTPKYPNDYTYALQRDRQIIYDRLGYTSVHFANPDGSWWYTRPVIKDPKTLLMSGGGTCYDIDPNDVYGKPAFRSTYVYQSDLSNVPLSEIRNTLLVGYIFNNNAPSTGNNWRFQYANAMAGKPTFAVELTHGIGYAESLPYNSFLENNLNFFNEIYDVVGANGVDWIWFCSGDEVIEYMYYQRVEKITKTITETGCKFNIAFDIPEYLSYKTYSVKIKNLPSNATVSMSTNETLTYYSKNMNTGLINWGVSPDISERANRYLAAYKANPTNDTLDRAWYFVKQMGEMGITLAAQLPAFNEKPVISSITYNATPTDSNINIVTTNSNKEFGEADYLDISTNEIFTSPTTFQIPYNKHKYYDPLDVSTRNDVFNININPNFGVVNTYYARLRNVYGNSNTYIIETTLTRVAGINDPSIDFIFPKKYTSDSDVTFNINHSYISAMRYKLTEMFTDWMNPTDSITIPMTKGVTYSLVVQGKNNLNEIVEKAYPISFTGKQQIVVFGNVSSSPTLVSGVGYVNITGRAGTTNRVIKDVDGNSFCTEQGQYYNNFKTIIDTLRTYWGVVDGAERGSAYWQAPALITSDGDYPNSIIYDGTNKNILSYGGARPNATYQAVKYLTGVPQGTYKVRLLVSTRGVGESNTANPMVLRVNNISQKITDTRIFSENNTIWQTFDNIVVDAKGYMLISQYTDVMFKADIYGLPPIVLIEIIKIG